VPKALAIPLPLSRSATQLAEIMAKVDRPCGFRLRSSRISISPDFRARHFEQEQMVSEFVARHVSPM
jgi:hypothetical protein